MPHVKKIKSIHIGLLFTDNDSIPESPHALQKMKPIVEHLRIKFGKAFHPFRNFSIDEDLLLFRARLSFRQYIPSKRHRFGIKLFLLYNCDTRHDFIIYTEASTNVQSALILRNLETL